MAEDALAWPSAVPREMVAFCEFLEHRVLTKNLALLRHMVRDFYVGHDQTLQEFIEPGVNLIAVLPFEHAGPRSRRVAAQLLLLQQQERQRPRADLPRAAPCVFLHLLARVGTKHMSWLKSIYSEFCDGRQETLVGSVRMGTQAISILPVNLLVREYQHHWSATPPSFLSMIPMPHDGGDYTGSDEFGRKSPSVRAPGSCDDAAAIGQRRSKSKKRAASPLLHAPSDVEDGTPLLEPLTPLIV